MRIYSENGAVGGLALGSKVGFSNTKKDMMVIKNKKALGFVWETMDPFLFCVHHEDAYPQGNKDLSPDASLDGRNIGQDFLLKDGWRMYHGHKVPGFPGHPHRGFETVTVVRKGMVDHTDSMGASGRYGDGDVQWMTAGKGIQHAEMFPMINQDKGNSMELFQIWLNLPKANKFVEPHFKMLWSEDIPNHKISNKEGEKIKIEVIAGDIESSKSPSPPPNSWANNPNNEVAIWNVEMDAHAVWGLPKASKGINRTIYFFKGDVLKLNKENLEVYHSAELVADEAVTIYAGEEKACFLILQGKPIGEPVVQHGPFVMNTRQEIQQAFLDYQKTEFGGWPWEDLDPVHGLGKGRFASHADGRKEMK